MKSANGDENSPPEEGKGLGKRIAMVAELVGGKRELARRAGIKESQLYRYINGTNIPSVHVAVDIANSGDVDVSWLATGYGAMMRVHAKKSKSEPYGHINEDFFIRVAARVEDILENMHITISFYQKLRILIFVYQQCLSTQIIDLEMTKKIIAMAAPDSFGLEYDEEIKNLLDKFVEGYGSRERLSKICDLYNDLAEEFEAPGLLLPIDRRKEVIQWLQERVKEQKAKNTDEKLKNVKVLKDGEEGPGWF